MTELLPVDGCLTPDLRSVGDLLSVCAAPELNLRLVQGRDMAWIRAAKPLTPIWVARLYQFSA
jgi:hypothetical protein